MRLSFVLLLSSWLFLTSCDSSTPSTTSESVPVGDPWIKSATSVTGGGAMWFGADSSSAGHVVAVGTIDGGATVKLSSSTSVAGTFASGSNLLIASYGIDSSLHVANSPEVAPNESGYNSIAMDNSFRYSNVGGFIVGTEEFTINRDIKVSGGVSGVRNAALVKYNADLRAVWAKSVVSGEGESEILGVAIDSDLSIYAVGYISGNMTAYNFGNGVSITGQSTGFNGFLIKYDADGNPVWAKTLTAAPNQSKFLSVALDSAKNVYVGGYLTDTGVYDFGNSITLTPVAASGRSNAFITKYNSAGAAQWAVGLTGASTSTHYNSLAMSADQTQIYAVGYAESADTLTFGNSKTVTTPDGPCSFVIAYDISGVAQWVSSSSGVCNLYLYGVSVDSTGAVYVGGVQYAAGSRDFGNSKVVTYTEGESRGLLLKYSSSGTAQSYLVPTASTGGSPSSRYAALSGNKSSAGVFGAGWLQDVATYTFDTLTAAGLLSNESTPFVHFSKP